MRTKVCFKCQRRRPVGDFYVHPQMGDGHLGKCKECTRRDVRQNRLRRIAYYREYGRTYARKPEVKKRMYESLKIRRAAHPEKERAHRVVNYMVRSGKWRRLPCEVCGNPRSHAHHDDYSKPLDVRWLCCIHHVEAHNGHFARRA